MSSKSNISMHAQRRHQSLIMTGEENRLGFVERRQFKGVERAIMSSIDNLFDSDSENLCLIFAILSPKKLRNAEARDLKSIWN